LRWLAIYRFALRVSRIATRLSFIFAAIYAAIQWEAAKIDAQVKETLAFYDRYNSPPFTQYRADLATLIARNRDPLVAAANEAQYSAQIMTMMKSNDSANGFDLLSDLFDGLSECVSSGLCDQYVAAGLFQPRAQELFNQFFPYVKFVREQNKVTSFAIGLENTRNLQPAPPGLLRRLANYFL